MSSERARLPQGPVPVMPQEVTKVRLFVASPGDVLPEREALKAVVEEINFTHGQRLGFVVELVRWETHCRPGMGRPQGLVNELIGGYDIFLGIMWNRFGTPTGEADSGTEEEFNLAYAEWERGGRPHILFYFCQAPCTFRTQEELEQRAKVLRFQGSLREKGITWEYAGRDSFADTVRPHLSNLLLDMFSGRMAAGDAPDAAERLRQVQEGLNKLGIGVASGTIEFPDTPEGRERLEAFRRSMERGDPLTVPRDYVKGDLPDLLAALGAESSEGAVVTFGTAPTDKSVLVRAVLECPDGTTAALDHIHLRNTRRGDKEAAFDNLGQPLPWKFEMVLGGEGVRWDIRYSTKGEPPNARRELDSILFGEAMAKGGTLRLVYAETGLDLSELSVAPGVFPPPDAGWKRMIERLVLIQEKVRAPLGVPPAVEGAGRRVAPEDVKAIFETAQKLETGRASLSVTNWETAVGPALAAKLIDLFGKGEPVSLSFSTEDEVVKIFGVDVSLGPFVYTCQQTYITGEDLEALRERAARAKEGESIRVRFTPFGGAPMLLHYLNWLPPADRDFLLNQMRTAPSTEPDSD